MKIELKDMEVEEVVGGEVVLSAPLKMVGFNTTGEVYKMKGNPTDMRNKLIELYDANKSTMGNAEFDQLVKTEFKNQGWI